LSVLVGHYTAADRQFHVRTEMPDRRVQRNVGVRDYGPSGLHTCRNCEKGHSTANFSYHPGTHNLEVKAITRSDWIMTSVYVLQ
jgi:hypothetical protein